MTLAQYAKSKGYSKEQFFELKKGIDAWADTALITIKEKYNPGSGMYYPCEGIFNDDFEFTPYIKQKLKTMGVEFIENGTMFRY